MDTNVLSEVVKKKPHPEVVTRLESIPPSDLATSVICVAELRHGTARFAHGARLWRRLEREVLTHVRILPLLQAEAVRAGDLLAALESAGEPIGLEDVLIGATAVEGGLKVATRNVRNFRRIPGLAVESWWNHDDAQ